MSGNFQIRDARTERRFFVDNAIMRQYGAELGPYGIATYCALCCFADKDEQDCFPSVGTIADMIGAGTTKVREMLRKLEELGLIHTMGRSSGDGQTSNLYTILNPPNVERCPPQRHTLPPPTPYVDEQSSINNPHDIHDNPSDSSSGEEHGGNGHKKLPPHQANFAMMARVCKIKPELMTDKQRGQLNAEEKRLREAVNATADDIYQFGLWWYREWWKGQNDQPPRPSQIREDWGVFEDWRDKNGPDSERVVARIK